MNNFTNNSVTEDIAIDLETFSIQDEINRITQKTKIRNWDILIRLYVSPNITSGGVVLPNSAQDNKQYASCVGLVVSMSAAAYQDPRYSQTGKWCEIGEWAVFPRHTGTRTYLNGIPLWSVKEDAILYTVMDPRDITRDPS